MTASDHAPPHTLTLHRYQRTNKRYTEDLGNGVTVPSFFMGKYSVTQTQ